MRELWEELGLEAEVGLYLGLVEHSWEDAGAAMNYELNHLFEVSLPTLGEGQTPHSREAHLTFFWAEVSRLTEYVLEPYPLRALLRETIQRSLWGTTLPPPIP